MHPKAQINRGSHKTCHGKPPPGNCYGNHSREKVTVDPEFVAYMRTQNFTAEQATDVAEGTDMYRWWNDQAGWQTQGNILARLRHMFDNLEASAASAKQQDALLMDPEVDNPIDKKTHETLPRSWLSMYGCRLHPTQEGTHQVLGSMWRSLLSILGLDLEVKI